MPRTKILVAPSSLGTNHDHRNGIPFKRGQEGQRNVREKGRSSIIHWQQPDGRSAIVMLGFLSIKSPHPPTMRASERASLTCGKTGEMKIFSHNPSLMQSDNYLTAVDDSNQAIWIPPPEEEDNLMVSQSAVRMHESPSNKWSNCPLKMCALLGLARLLLPAAAAVAAPPPPVGASQGGVGWPKLCAAKVRLGRPNQADWEAGRQAGGRNG